MALVVNTNTFSMTAQKNLSVHSDKLAGSFAKLSSGLRIVSAADDAAGLGISERMRAEIRSLGMAQRNAQDGVSLVQTAEGALSEVSGNLIRMRELAVEAANGTLNTADRTSLDQEFQALDAEIDRVASETEFNGIALLDGTNATIDIQVGTSSGQTISINTVDMQSGAGGLAISTLDVTTAANASAALADLDSAIDSVVAQRGDFGASQNRLSSAMRSIATAKENLSGAESRIRDVDVASETAELTKNRILQQAAASVLGQANTQPQLAMSLLQG
ncbi:MAG: flagellin [Planctomycetota bacterium]|jgi:flagellin|nr:flagellin [Planctomycetota bacterium]MDG2143211.1 flagellin [Planctomycetota bacterium]